MGENRSETTFLTAVLDDPDDDIARPIFADWLEERGQPRGKLIRVQYALESLPVDDERRPELLSRELHLLNHHSKQWAGPLRGLVKRWGYRRGFIESIKIPADKFLQHTEELFELAPIRELHLLGGAFLAWDVAACPYLEKITALAWSGYPFSAWQVRGNFHP